jgi:hypothetical protein
VSGKPGDRVTSIPVKGGHWVRAYCPLCREAVQAPAGRDVKGLVVECPKCRTRMACMAAGQVPLRGMSIGSAFMEVPEAPAAAPAAPAAPEKRKGGK